MTAISGHIRQHQGACINGALWRAHRFMLVLLAIMAACSAGVRGDYMGLSSQPSYGMLGRLGHELLNAAGGQPAGAITGPAQSDPFTRKWTNTIALCALMKDEHIEDVKEWISYHRYAGVDKFYLRENGNSSSIEADMQPYVAAGIVDFGLYDGPKHPTQTNWYNECSRLAKPTHSWVGFIDLDEFIVVLHKQRAVVERNALRNMLRRSFRYTAAVSMQWVLFGSGGHKTRPAQGQLAGFNRCTGVLSKQMKCLGNSYWFHENRTFRPTHVHQCNFRSGAVAVLGNSEPLNMWRVDMEPNVGTEGPFGSSYAGHLSDSEHRFFTDITSDYQVALFHYVTRSQDDFVQRKINLRSGKYATQFAAVAAIGGDLAPSDQEMDAQYATFEREHGFDGQHLICEQGASIAGAMERARSERGWNEFKP